MNDLFLILLIVFLVLVLPWILLIRARRRRMRMQEEWDDRFAEQARRIYKVETTLEALKRDLQSSPAQSAPAATPEPAREAAVVSPPVEIPKAKPTAIPPPAASPISAPPVVPPSPQIPAPVAPPTFLPAEEPQPGYFDRLKGFDIEEALGTNWLNKIGIVILVFGIAFFLAYQLKEMGPAGKVMVGFVVSLALLGGGVFLERRKGYELLGRAGLGGGWALAFFTTYAMYHVRAAAVLTSETLDLVLMGLVAAGMVAHSLRYRSQLVTGLAFILAFSTCTISQVTVYSLSAGVILAAALVVIVVRMRWWELEIFGILAVYLNHFYWLYHIIEPMGGHKHPFPQFIPSAAILIAYWALFRASYVLRSVENADEERLATVSALLNSFGLLGLLKYQSVHPEWAFWALLVLGTVETLLSLYARRRRRLAFIVLATIGISLLFAAFPFRFSMMSVSVLWVAGVEALLFVGIFTREIVFRRLAMIAAGAATVQILSVDIARVIGIRMDGASPDRIIPLGIAIVFAAAAFYGDATYVRRRWSELFDEDSDRLRLVCYAASALLLGGLWVLFPQLETAPAWALGGVLLAAAASRIEGRETQIDLKIQCDVFALLALFRAAVFNLESTATWTSHHISQRLVTVALCALALYVASRARPVYALAAQANVPAGYTWAASFLVGTLLWYELHSVSVASAWALFGLILLETGTFRRSFQLRLQGYVALLLAFVRIFTANLAADGQPGQLSPRIYSTLPVIFILAYAYWRISLDDSDSTARDRSFRLPQICSWMSLVAFAALIRFEIQADWVAVAWAAFVPVLLAISWSSGRHIFTAQALIMVLGTAARAGLHNLYERTVIPGPILYSRLVCVGSACALLFFSLPIAYRLLRAYPAADETAGKWRRASAALLRRPEQTLFFAPFLLVIGLLWVEMSKGLLTVSWSVFGVITFLFGLWLGERSFRLAGIGLLLLGVAKIVVIDVWSLGPRDRYLTFISMGAACLLVSFLWTRFRETLRRYL